MSAGREDLKPNMATGEVPPVYVALDLETTGLNHDVDAIIEVGAVKFQGRKVLESFQTLVNPYRDLPRFIQALTGISQKNVDRAPPFAAVAGDLSDFIGPLPVVGHNISFDLNFLSRHGVQLTNDSYDTWDLASMLLPYSMEYSLASLGGDFGADHTRPHRALSDAQATHQVFLALIERARALDPSVAAYIRHLASRSRWPLGRLFDYQASDSAQAPSPPAAAVGLTGVDMQALARRLERVKGDAKHPKGEIPFDSEELAAFLAPEGMFSRAISGFEHRPQQIEMLRSIVGAFDRDQHLLVEAGTGVGKSVAYLLPAILYSLKSGTRVVVSTNTINLQEQLLQKDIPMLVGMLEDEGIISKGEFKAVPLKGRANYLCLRRWNHLAKSDGLNQNEARILGKTLVWLQDTAVGDRAEINLSGRDAVTWSRVSADEKGQCPGMRGEGPCFLRAARDRAEGANIIVVNHALLLSDLAMGGRLLPEYQHLIVDEAHHLEEVATRQLGTQVSQNRLTEDLDGLWRLLLEVRVLLGSPSTVQVQTRRVEENLSELESTWTKRTRDSWERLWDVLDRFLSQQQEDSSDREQLQITRSTRSQAGWSDVEVAWENVDVNLADGARQLEALCRLLDALPSEGTVDLNPLMGELTAWSEGVEELREGLKTLIEAPAEDRRIDWIDRSPDRRSGPGRSFPVALHTAPLNVGMELEESLFSRKRSVTLTSATLSAQGTLDYFRDRIGVAESEELLVGSPFDYRRAALLLIPEDIPTPDLSGYQRALEQVVVELCKALNGRTMVLFTSHSALRGTAQAVRGHLESEGIRVLAQGIDGSPRQVLRSFAEQPRGLILGTSSFWEGVDLSGGILKALVLARLPFHVPTEPIFAARSAQYEDPFHAYALPQAVLRFRQGIGRLIRGSQDKGTIVVLDRRIIARSYGKAFLDSIPPCTVKRGPLAAIPGYAADWVGEGS